MLVCSAAFLNFGSGISSTNFFGRQVASRTVSPGGRVGGVFAGSGK